MPIALHANHVIARKRNLKRSRFGREMRMNQQCSPAPNTTHTGRRFPCNDSSQHTPCTPSLHFNIKQCTSENS